MKHETLFTALKTVEDKRKIVAPVIYGGVGYNESIRLHIEPNYELEKMSTRSKKMLHIIVNRDDNGMYEILDYIL